MGAVNVDMMLFRLTLALAPCLMLAACSGEPSESDMRSLVEAHTRKALEAKGTPGFRQFDEFRKQGCVDARGKNSGGNSGAAAAGAQYDCYYAATFTPQPGRPAITVNGKGRFTRTDKGLLFEDLGAQPK